MEYRDTLLRYVGRRVCVSTFGHVKLWGEIAAVNEDSLRLTNTVVGSEGEDQWLMQSQYADSESTYGVRHAETIVHFHHIVAITCLDDDLPPIDNENPFMPLEASDSGPIVTASLRGGPSVNTAETTRSEDSLAYLHCERLEILIGLDLVKLAKNTGTGGLVDRITNVRNLIGSQLGFLVPTARIRDSARFEANEYRIYVNGTETARGALRPEKILAIDGGKAKGTLEGEKTVDPAFGQPSIWIEPALRETAERLGYFTVEPAAVLATHFQREVRRRAGELLSLDGLRSVLEHVRQQSPVVIDEIIPSRISLTKLHDVLSRLLEEETPLRPLERILEKIAHLENLNRDSEEILPPLRVSLGRTICERFRDAHGVLHVFTLDRTAHDRFLRILAEKPQADDPRWLQRAIEGLRAWYTERRTQGRDLPLVVDSVLRRRLWQLLAHQIPGLAVLSFAEVPRDLSVNLTATIGDPELGIVPPKAKRKKAAARRRTDPAHSSRSGSASGS